MTPLILKVNPEKDMKPPSIIVHTMSGKYFCTIMADGEVRFNPEFDYSTDELEQVLCIQKLFFTIYNSLVEKDKLIASLQEMIVDMGKHINPIIERQ